MMDTTDETVSSAVYRFAVRLPPIWPDRPAVWFAQAKAQFELASIKIQRTKFNYVVSLLNQHQAADVEVIISSAPVHEPSNRLKAELVRRFSISLEEYVRQLLSHDEMGEWEVWSRLKTSWTILFDPSWPTESNRTCKTL